MGKVKHYDFAAEQERQQKQINAKNRQTEQRSFEKQVMRTLEKQDAEIFALRAEVNSLHKQLFLRAEALERLIYEKDD